jgi:Sir2- and TIR-associating SLOG family/SIR2-like domain
MASAEMKTFLNEYTRALREGDAALFVGAGVSRAAGFVDWKQLLKGIADDLELDVDRETDLVALAQFHVNKRGGRDRLNQLLIDEFLEDVALTPSHSLIATLPVHTVWTTNYDDLLETAFTSAGKRVDVKRRQVDFATTRRRTDVTIYKMHGDKTNPAEAILTKEDYETYNATRELFTIALKGDLAKTTFLFLGFSFADPNVIYILGRVKQLLEKNSRKHYCVLKAPQSDGSAAGDYDVKRFSHWLTDLHRYNIQPVLIERYEEVPEILSELNRRSHLSDVFISGSAADFAPLGEGPFHELCRLLGAELIRKKFNVISGFGLGVGDMVVVGAMQALQRNDDERLQLRPFPQQVPAGIDRAAFWRQYRERMMADAGVCIVLAGNKRSAAGAIVPADGVRQEVEIARAQGKAVVPIGATGHVARELWEQARAKPSDFGLSARVAAQIEVLGDASATVVALVDATIAILKDIDS